MQLIYLFLTIWLVFIGAGYATTPSKTTEAHPPVFNNKNIKNMPNKMKSKAALRNYSSGSSINACVAAAVNGSDFDAGYDYCRNNPPYNKTQCDNNFIILFKNCLPSS